MNSKVYKINQKIKLIIFDLDGTILNLPINYDALRKEIKIILRPFGIKSKLVPLLVSINKAISKIEKDFGAERAKEISMIIKEILDKYEVNAAKNAKLLPNVKVTLESLKKFKIKLAIFSKNGKKGVLKALEKTKIKKYFDIIITREDVKKQKPNPEGLRKILHTLGVDAKESLFVGNDIVDILAGKKIKLKTVGITPEREKAKILVAKGAFKVINNFFKLLEILNLN